MKINEVSTMTGMTKRAIKYYEEKGLLHIKKKENGYRSYTMEDVKRLKEIALYRKLDISLPDIQQLLHNPDQKTALLQTIYTRKRQDHKEEELQLAHLQQLLKNECSIDAMNHMEEALDYRTIAKALEDMIPGPIGQFFLLHFLPYLQIPLVSEEQKEAYHRIVNFLDDLKLKPTLGMQFSAFLMKNHTKTKEAIYQMHDVQIKNMLNPSEEEYEAYKASVWKHVQLRKKWYHRWNPFLTSRRHFMKRLQDCGYYDFLIPNMKQLSPLYKDYHDALLKLNDRICRDTGIHYDSHYHLK